MSGSNETFRMAESLTSSPTRPLCEQLAETCILQCYVIETLDAQQNEPVVRHRAEINTLLDHMLEVLHAHTTELASLLEPLPEGHSAVSTDNWLASRAANFTGRTPRSELRAMLLDDCALLNLTAMHYKILLNAAAAESDNVVSQMAREHFDELVKLTEEVARVLPPAAPMLGEAAPEPRPMVRTPFRVSVWQTSPTAA
jgi:hypothetical protein